MTNFSNDKTKSGGKGKATSSKDVLLTLPKKVRTETAKITAKLGISDDDESRSDCSFIDTSLPSSQYLHRAIASKEYSVNRLMTYATIGSSHAVSQDVRDSKGALRYGNFPFLQWADCGFDWPLCERFDAPFAVLGRKTCTWESAFEWVFTREDRDWDCLECLVRQALDPSAFTNWNKPEEDMMWDMWCLMMGGVALSDPMDLWDYSAPTWSDGSFLENLICYCWNFHLRIS